MITTAMAMSMRRAILKIHVVTGSVEGEKPATVAPLIVEHCSEVAVDLPACDSSKSDVFFIRQNSDWDQINNSSYRVFCVHPGDYRGRSRVALTRDGSSSAPRWIRFYDPNRPNDTSAPWERSAQARVPALELKSTSWWEPGRAYSGRSAQSERALLHSILKRQYAPSLLLERADKLIVIRNDSNRNTIQRSVFRNTTTNPGSDGFCLFTNPLIGGGIADNVVASNEFYNCAGDGWQLNNSNGDPKSDFVGNVIENNDFYLNKRLLHRLQRQSRPER